MIRTRTLAATVALAALAACSSGPKRVRNAPPPPAIVAVTAAETDAVFSLLMTGRDKEAREQLKKLLKRDPQSATAGLLRDSVERDPKDLLGPQSFPYTVRAGDTAEGVAQRLLGNRLKAYQLIRYNELRPPVILTPGQVLRIPGELPRVEPIRRPEPTTPRPSASTPAPATKPKPAAPKAVAPAAPAANPAGARSARAAGLAALNGGDVNRAVGLLRRAAALDRGNPLIARDLARAERIAATVRARK
ncbi:LysM peptidoglycan-binding domain-containing protein [Sphingomonas sp.]|jgi:LysM repeat protein|uniref:LysM peptidoglycan-binding domain-containing protein n=1 Tax=Sphingomonas sp. TaxID=28214 RepID=UPI002D7FD495|nr:LysM peptidoglycan-binding domain-containing protein [Sphingomonas sp.]HEU0043935.1 LysM peptidoglycan-binding domain-containing protein [Sphingomonas sp.]